MANIMENMQGAEHQDQTTNEVKNLDDDNASGLLGHPAGQS